MLFFLALGQDKVQEVIDQIAMAHLVKSAGVTPTDGSCTLAFLIYLYPFLLQLLSLRSRLY